MSHGIRNFAEKSRQRGRVCLAGPAGPTRLPAATSIEISLSVWMGVRAGRELGLHQWRACGRKAGSEGLGGLFIAMSCGQAQEEELLEAPAKALPADPLPSLQNVRHGRDCQRS